MSILPLELVEIAYQSVISELLTLPFMEPFWMMVLAVLGESFGSVSACRAAVLKNKKDAIRQMNGEVLTVFTN